MSTLIESMTKVPYVCKPGVIFTIRCWRQEVEYDEFVKHGTATDISIAVSELKRGLSAKQVCETLLALVSMNAVEVIDNDGNGLVMYKDWP